MQSFIIETKIPKTKRRAIRPLSEREKLKDMVQCANCSKCVIRKKILRIEANPEEICEHCIEGICSLEESRYAHTLEEVGQILGMTREGARQIEAKALKKLSYRKTLQSFYDDSFRKEKDNGRPCRS